MPRLLLCDCGGSFRPDADAIEAGTGLTARPAASALCTAQSERLSAALAEAALDGGHVIVACAQQAEIFSELAEAAGAPAPLAVDIRDRAGWTDEAGAGATGPKQAALLAAARLNRPPVPLMDLESEGLCLVLGPAEIALAAAARLAEALSVTVLLAELESLVE
ncbi:MAG: (4Fe-4S)-binding protein, partial [Pseudomonadota bacterium]